MMLEVPVPKWWCRISGLHFPPEKTKNKYAAQILSPAIDQNSNMRIRQFPWPQISEKTLSRW